MEENISFIKYHNRLNDISIANLSALHLNLLMAIISKFNMPIYDPDTKAMSSYFDSHYADCIHFTYEELRRITNLTTKNCNNKVFCNLIDGMYKGLCATNCAIEDGSRKIQFILFPTFCNDSQTKTLDIEVHRLFRYLFMNLNRDFTAFNELEFNNLKGKHEKYLYIQIRHNRGMGRFKCNFEDYKYLTGIDEECSNSYILYRIIKPAVEAIKKYVPSLSLSSCKTGKSHNLVAFELFFEITTKDLKFNNDREVLPQKAYNKPNKKETKRINQAFSQREYSNFEYDMLEKKKLNIISPQDYTKLISLYSKLKSRDLSASEKTEFQQSLSKLSIDSKKYAKLNEL